MEKEEVKISVRELVEFILRSGDIDNRRGGWADKESLAKGTRIHKKIQRQMGAAYQAEVPLNCRFCYEDLDLLVEGRADGIEEKEDHVMVDEIKGVHRELRFVEEPVPVHLHNGFGGEFVGEIDSRVSHNRGPPFKIVA